MPDRFLIAREIGELLGVSQQRVRQLADLYADWPTPMVVGRQKMYAERDVKKWIENHRHRGPGRRVRAGARP